MNLLRREVIVKSVSDDGWVEAESYFETSRRTSLVFGDQAANLVAKKILKK